MARGDSIAIDMVRRRLRAIEAVPSRGRLRVRRVLTVTAPESLDIRDPEAVGAWAAEQLRSAGFPRGRAIFAIPREAVALKRLTLPTTDPSELPGMVELAMHRDLPFDASTAVIDFITVGERDGQTTVMAAAIPQPALDTVHAIARASGLRPRRISLRCLGTAALLRSMQQPEEAAGAWLGVDITHDGVELAVVDGADIRFSRAAEVSNNGEVEEFTDNVVTETRRSWMSYRILEDAEGVQRAFVTGDESVARAAATAITEVIGVPVVAVERHPHVDANDRQLAATWPLAGLLLETMHGSATIDFCHPRRPPDRNARKRMMAMAAAGMLLLAGVTGMLASKRSLDGLRKQLDAATSEVNGLRPVFVEYERKHWRLMHLDRWEEAGVDWLGHLTFLQTRLPDPNQVVLNEWAGTMRFNGVRYDRRGRTEAEKWSVPREITISLAGEARTRELADAFRASLVTTRDYTTRPSGPDTAGGKRFPAPSWPFKLTLRSTASTLSPDDESSEIDSSTQARAGGQRSPEGLRP